MDRFIVVAPAEYLAVPINRRQSLVVGQRDVQPDGADFAFEPAIDQRQKRIAALSRNGRQRDALRITQHVVLKARPRGRVDEIDLVHHLDQPAFDGFTEPEIDQHAEHVPALGLAVGMISVADVDDDVGFGDFLEGRPEGGDEMVGRSDMKPTVSDRIAVRPEGKTKRRIVGSRVANSISPAGTEDRVNRLNSVDFPALV